MPDDRGVDDVEQDAAATATAAAGQAAQAQARAAEARQAAEQAREESVVARDESRTAAALVKPDDPLLDTAVRRFEARADEEFPFGRPGRPMNARSPFRIAFTAALGVAAAYVLLQALAEARQVLVLIAVSAFLAIGLDPTVVALGRRGLSRGVSVGIVFAGVIAFFVGFGFAVVPPIVAQTGDFVGNLPRYLTELRNNPTIARLDNRYHIVAQVSTYISAHGAGTAALGGIVGVGRVVFNAFFSALTILILTLYFLASFPVIKSTGYRVVPRSRRARVGLLTDEILARVGGYVAGAITIAAIAGLSSLIFLLAIGTPYALALAMLVAILDVVPLVGATLGAAVVTLVVFVGVSVPAGIWAILFYLAYQQVENYLIYPRVMSRSVDVSPAATIVAVLIGGALLGIVGALLAIPVTAAVQLVFREVIVPRQDQT